MRAANPYDKTRKNEKRNNIITLIIVILFFAIAIHCSGQSSIKRYTEDPDVTTYYPTEPMYFFSGEDTLIVSVLADSIGKFAYIVKVFVFYPKNKDVNEYQVIQIRFDDGSKDAIFLTEATPELNYGEYQVSGDLLKKMKEQDFNVLSFETATLIEPCTKIQTKSFFRDFLNKL